MRSDDAKSVGVLGTAVTQSPYLFRKLHIWLRRRMMASTSANSVNSANSFSKPSMKRSETIIASLECPQKRSGGEVNFTSNFYSKCCQEKCNGHIFWIVARNFLLYQFLMRWLHKCSNTRQYSSQTTHTMNVASKAMYRKKCHERPSEPPRARPCAAATLARLA